MSVLDLVNLLTRLMPLSIWATGAAALLLFAAIVIVQRARERPVLTMFGGVAFVLAGALAVWASLDWAAVRDRAAERRALDQRMAELNARAIAPGSALACLDAIAGDTVETACEKAVFASPEAVAAAVSYVAARLALLADGTAYISLGGAGYETSLAPTRLALETDRFGIVAHIFAVRDSCTALQCDSLALLQDASRVEANLRERTFEGYVGRHAADWSTSGAPASAPTADAGSPPSLASTGSLAPTGVPVPSRYDFPSAASIPPVSIMNPEPGTGAAAKPPVASMPATPPLPPHRPSHTRGTPPRAAAAASAARPGASPPVQLAPPASGGTPLR